MNIFEKFAHDEDNNHIDNFKYIFIYMTFIFGLAFTVLPHVLGADQTVLYKVTQLHLNSSVTSAWGIVAMITATAVFFNTYYRNTFIGSWGSFVGASLWIYALIIYITDHYWFGLLAGAIPNLWFWSLYYLRIKRFHYKRNE